MEGSLLVGVGDAIDPGTAVQANAGDASTLHPGTRHYFIARGKTRIRVTFVGPYTVTYVDADRSAGEAFYPFGH